MLSPEWDISPAPKAQGHCRRNERMEDPGERIECFRNTVFWPWHDSCLLFYFIYYILLCTCMMRGGGGCTCGGQRTSFWSDFSPSNFIRLLRVKLRSSSLKDKHFYPESSPPPGPGTQQLWLSTQDLPKTEPVKLLYGVGGGAHKASPLPGTYWQLTVARGRGAGGLTPS